MTALLACGLLLITARYLETEKSILISVCPQMVSVQDRYVWYHDELMHSLWKHKFKNAELLADRLAALKMNPSDAQSDDALWFYDLLVLGRYSQLMAMVQRTNSLPPNCYYWHYLKAESLLGLHEYKNALNEFLIARPIAAEQPYLLMGLVKANLAVGNRAEAKHLIRKLYLEASSPSKLYPDSSSAWKDAYLALIDLKQNDEVAAQQIASEFARLMSEPLDEMDAIAQLDFVSEFMRDMGYERQALTLSATSERIKER